MKADALGRVRTPAAKRAEILAAFERSGGSGAEFAALVVKYSAFASWMQERRRPRGALRAVGSGVRFLEVALLREAGRAELCRETESVRGGGPVRP